MRSLTFTTIAITTILAAMPLASAQASSDALDQDMSASFQGPRITALTDQVDGVRQGIADARQGRELDAGRAGRLDMRAERIERIAERLAAADRGRIPAQDYRRLLRRLDGIDQQLIDDTGGDLTIGNGSGGGRSNG